MFKNTLRGIAALAAVVCLSASANAVIVKHTYSGIVYSGGGNSMIFGKNEDELGGSPFTFSMSFNPVAPGAMRFDLTVGDFKKTFTGTGSISLDVITCGVYWFECMGHIDHSASFSSKHGQVTGYASFFWHLWWPEDDPVPYSTDITAAQSFGVDLEDFFGGITVLDNQGGMSLDVWPDTLVIERIEPVPLPPALPMLVTGLLLLGWGSARLNGKSLHRVDVNTKC